MITLGADSDVALGGFGSDTFTDAGGQNAIVGDEGIVTFTGRLISRIESVGNTGAADTFTGATGDDLVIGGAGGDTINAGAGNNVAIGDFGVISLNGGIVVSVEATNPMKVLQTLSREQRAMMCSLAARTMTRSAAVMDATSCLAIEASSRWAMGSFVGSKQQHRSAAAVTESRAVLLKTLFLAVRERHDFRRRWQ